MGIWIVRIGCLVVVLAVRAALGWSHWSGLLVYVGIMVAVEGVLLPLMGSRRRSGLELRLPGSNTERPRPAVGSARGGIEARLIARPNDVPALWELAALLERDRDWTSALNAYNNLIYHSQDQGDHARAFFGKGRILEEELGLPAKAIAHYEKCIAVDPSHVDARERLAALTRQGAE